MPVYEYTCRKCQHDFEELLIWSRDEQRVTCPRCGARTVTRRLSTFAARGAPLREPAARGPCGRCGDPAGPCSLE